MDKYLIVDTETTGLHIITDKLFIIPYGIVDEHLNLISSHLATVNDDTSMNLFKNYFNKIKYIVGHNIKYDIHMLINYGIDMQLIESKTYIDTAVLARLSISHDKQILPTFSTALKALAKTYLNVDSADLEKQVKLELTRLTSAHKQKLKVMLENKYNKKFTTGVINDIYTYKSWCKTYHKYTAYAADREQFFKTYVAPNYSDCQSVIPYALKDISLTHGLFKLFYPKAVQLKQTEALIRICDSIIPLVHMERKGLVVDIKRLVSDRNTLLKEFNKTKIIDPRTGVELSIGQHAKLKELYEYESGRDLEAADKNVRAEIEDVSPSAKKASYIALIEKYLSSYITRVLSKVQYIDNDYRIYTQYNLAGTVTGRLSSDFQQFPKEPLVLADGTIINIRNWFTVPKENKYMFYFDYSQMELKLQCEWTNVINGTPDINMVRAFSPYKCVNINGDYYLEEDTTKKWQPVDLHSMTASIAFPNVSSTDPDWKHYRTLGKRTNFACNYGAGAATVANTLKVPFDLAQKLVKGYQDTFKGVVDFSNWIRKRVYMTDSIPNLLLRRYYSNNSHLLLNWLVQGSGADILLIKLKSVYDYIKNKPWWNFMISVHDEIGLTCNDIPQAQLIQEVNEIKNIMSHQFSAITLTVDVEYTTKSWGEKGNWPED